MQLLPNWYKVEMRNKRINYVSTRLTDDELALLERLGSKKGMLPATLLRVALLDYAQKNGETLPRKNASEAEH
jgi:hypothetical protein